MIGRSIYQIESIGGREVLHGGSCIKGQDVPGRIDANARFIVTACNCHAELLEAIECIAFMGTDAPAATIDETGFYKSQLHSCIQMAARVLAALRPAIRNAEEQTK